MHRNIVKVTPDKQMSGHQYALLNAVRKSGFNEFTEVYGKQSLLTFLKALSETLKIGEKIVIDIKSVFDLSVSRVSTACNKAGLKILKRETNKIRKNGSGWDGVYVIERIK